MLEAKKVTRLDLGGRGGKTLVNPRHSLNAFSEPRPGRPLGTVKLDGFLKF